MPRNENEILLTPPEIFAPGQTCLISPRRLDEIDRVAVVLFDAGGDGEDVRIEDDVGRRHADFLGQQPIGPLADAHLVVDVGGLSLLVEGHDDDGGAVAADEPRVVQKLLFAFLEADRVDDRLALHAFQARLR